VLADRGEADQASTKPVRYRATATTTAAASVPPAASRSPRRARTLGTAAPPATTATPAPSVLSGSAATAVVSGPVTRPNGQLYHPRQLSGLPDVTALRKLREAGVASLLYGPPGTGKTSVVQAAFPDLVTVSGDGDTTVADLVGEYTQTPDGRYLFVFSELLGTVEATPASAEANGQLNGQETFHIGRPEGACLLARSPIQLSGSGWADGP
jgi:hypothetical protein